MCMYIVFMTLTQTMYFPYFRGSIYLIVVFIIICGVYCKESLSLLLGKDGVSGILYLTIALVLSYIVGGEALATTVALILTTRDMNLKKAIKFGMYVLVFILFFVIFSAKLGIISNYSIMRGGHIREYLGFRYSLYPAAILFNIVASYIYVYYKRVKLTFLFFLLLATLYIYVCTYAKLSTILIIFLICIGILDKYIDIFKNKFLLRIINILKYSYIFLPILSLWVTYNYKQSINWMHKLDLFLETRLSLAKTSLDLYGIKLFGIKNLAWQGNGLSIDGSVVKNNNYLYVDNFYINILQQHGMIFSILLLLLLTLVTIRAKRSGDNFLTFILIIFSFHGLIDNLMLTLYYNIFLLAITPYVFMKNNKSNSEDKK